MLFSTNSTDTKCMNEKPDLIHFLKQILIKILKNTK